MAVPSLAGLRALHQIIINTRLKPGDLKWWEKDNAFRDGLDAAGLDFVAFADWLSTTGKIADLGSAAAYIDNISNEMLNYTTDVDLRGLDDSIFYPVVFYINNHKVNKLSVSRSYAFSKDISAGLMSLFSEFSFIGGTWSGFSSQSIIERYSFCYKYPIARFSLIYPGYRAGIWLRGGYVYKFSSNASREFRVFSSMTKILDHQNNAYDSYIDVLNESDISDQLKSNQHHVDVADDYPHINS